MVHFVQQLDDFVHGTLPGVMVMRPETARLSDVVVMDHLMVPSLM